MLEAGWLKAYHPARGRAARARLLARSTSCAATSTSTAACARRPGTSSGSASPSRRARGRSSPATRAGCASRAVPGRAGALDCRARPRTTPAAAWSRRSARAPTRLPDRLQRALSLEGRGAGDRGRSVEGRPSGRLPYEAIPQLHAAGPAPLAAPVPGMAERTRLHIAVVIPPFGAAAAGTRRSSSWSTRLERAGHTCQHLAVRPARPPRTATNAAVLRRRVVDEFFADPGARVQGLRRLVRRRRRGRDRLGHRLPGAAAAAAAARAPTWSRTTSRSSSPRRPRRSGRRRPTGWACTASPRARGCATCSPRRYGSAAAAFQLGVDHERLPPAAGSSAGATR